MSKKTKVVGLLALLVLLLVCVWSFWRNSLLFKTQPEQADNTYVGEQSCKSCHQAEYHHWEQSDHFKAMQVATDSTVLGDFNNRPFNADGISSRFFKEGANFYVNTQGKDGKNANYEVSYTFGFYPLQQYLVDFPDGKKQVLRQSWDVLQKKWFHQYAGQQLPAGDWLHWTGNAQNWNSTCADCHSTDLKKNYLLDEDRYQTRYSALNVSCEACHGPGKKHIDYIKTDFRDGQKVKDSYLQLTKNSSPAMVVTSCAPCHSRRTALSAQLLPGHELLDNYLPELPTKENFFADGQMKEEVFNYASFMQSKMAQMGLSCNTCHDAHTQKTRLIGNALCMQCHQSKFNNQEHLRHAINTTASKCVSCHMPSQTYMGNDIRHDHSFRVPRPDLSARFATPNACNNCHKDKSAQWASSWVDKWYGKQRAYHFAEDLIPGSGAQPNAESHLLKLLEKKQVPNIIKATAVQYLADKGTAQSLRALQQCLKSEDAHIRYTALRSLMNYPQQNWMAAALPLLKDPVRAVRIAAADALLLTPADQLSVELQKPFEIAKKELYDFLVFQADFPSGCLILGDYYSRLQDYKQAEKYYLLGLKKDQQMNLARLNLAVVYNLQGKNQQAIAVLKEALKVDASNPQVYYNMALLYNEMAKPQDALQAFANAIKYKSNNPRVYYNYALLLLKNNPDKAQQVLQLALKQWPQENSLHYALAHVYYTKGNQPLAIREAEILKQRDGQNPEYQSLFKTLGL